MVRTASGRLTALARYEFAWLLRLIPTVARQVWRRLAHHLLSPSARLFYSLAAFELHKTFGAPPGWLLLIRSASPPRSAFEQSALVAVILRTRIIRHTLSNGP
jgi:hypothetical protein